MQEKITKKEEAYQLFFRKEQLLSGIQNAQKEIADINQKLQLIVDEIEKEELKK